MTNWIFICIYCRFLWSFNYIIAVTFTQSLTPFEIALGRWLVVSVVAYLAWNSAIAKIGSVQTGIVYYTLPLFSGIEAYFFVGEEVSLPQVYGGISVVLGIVLVSFNKKKCLKLDNKSSMH